jgi:hypothetical protein
MSLWNSQFPVQVGDSSDVVEENSEAHDDDDEF